MLTTDDYRILKFETQLGTLPRWRKAEAIRRHLQLTEVRYGQKLARLAGDPEALAQYPQTVYRVRAKLERGERERAARL